MEISFIFQEQFERETRARVDTNPSLTVIFLRIKNRIKTLIQPSTCQPETRRNLNITFRMLNNVLVSVYIISFIGFSIRKSK